MSLLPYWFYAAQNEELVRAAAKFNDEDVDGALLDVMVEHILPPMELARAVLYQETQNALQYCRERGRELEGRFKWDLLDYIMIRDRDTAMIYRIDLEEILQEIAAQVMDLIIDRTGPQQRLKLPAVLDVYYEPREPIQEIEIPDISDVAEQVANADELPDLRHIHRRP